MGALVLWAIVCGGLLVLSHLIWRRFLDRRIPKPAVPAAAAIFSLALCEIPYLIFDKSYRIFDEAGISIIENALSTARFRNALFGIAIAVLAWLWFEGRRTGPAETGKPSDVEAGKSKLRKSSELPLVLLVIVTFVAVVASELPGIVGNFRVGFGTGGLFLEPVDPRKNDGQGFFSYSEKSKDSGRAGLATLSHLEWLAGSSGEESENLMLRDAKRVCILVEKEKKEERCLEAVLKIPAYNAKILAYNAKASMTTTPVFRCMVAVTKELKDQELAKAFVRPVATAYMRAVRAGAEMTAREDLHRALIDFSGQLNDDVFSLSKSAESECGKVVADPDMEVLDQLLNLHRELPYGHIAYAIFASFFGDTASGVLALQRWEDGNPLPPLVEAVDGTEEKALRIWTGYVARSFQNFLIIQIPNDLLKVTMLRYDWEARRILEHFRGDFIAVLDREDSSNYCDGESNQELMRIYRLSIQESEDEMTVLLDGDRYGLLSAFADRSIHIPAKVLDGYERFKFCFRMLYDPPKIVDFWHVKILESLGRYKMQYALYVMRRESTLHPERRPARLCDEAVAHFEAALHLLPRRSDAEAALLRPRTRMVGLVASLSMESPYPEEALRRRLAARLDVIRASGGCSQW